MPRKKSLDYDTTVPLLGVFLHEKRVGTLGQSGADVWFKYDDWVVEQSDEWIWRLSIKLPIRSEPFGHEPTLVFFDNLLIESDTRAELAAIVKRDVSDVTGLLGRVGGECAGAVSLWPINLESPPQAQYRSLPESELEEIFSERHGTRLGQLQLESRQVMSGVQHKLVVRNDRRRYELPLMGSPSTAILKRSTGRYPDLAANELFCLKALLRLELGAAHASVVGGGNGILEIQRYDRKVASDGSVSRLHQEDFCQATGRLVARKYQHSGGPGLGEIAEVLRRHSVNPPEDIRRLIGAAIWNVCVGNMDAHAKNFSLLYGTDGPRLAPFYDVVSTEVYPGLDVDLSMRFGHSTDPRRIAAADINRLARDLKVTRRAIESEAGRVLTILGDELDALIAEADAETGSSEILGRIGQIVRTRIDVLSTALVPAAG